MLQSAAPVTTQQPVCNVFFNGPSGRILTTDRRHTSSGPITIDPEEVGSGLSFRRINLVRLTELEPRTKGS